MEKSLARSPVDVPVVAVGASAGGITALQKLFEGLPAKLPFALVVLQHLPSDRPSGLPDLIARWTHLPVQVVADGMRPETNTVYVPAPDHILTLENGRFHTSQAQGGGRRPGIDTIDAFLESLALREEPRSIAVILSGTGMDGTAGAVRIRQAGGIVIVQDPLTALHDSMPQAVIQRGIHDHILPVGAMGRQLVACADPAYVRPTGSADWTGGMSQTLGRIIELVGQRAGFNLSGYKPSPLLWRVQQRMDMRKVWSFDDYALLLEDDPVELEALVRGIPIHVTEFFRDSDAWEILGNDVLRPLVAAAGTARTVRVWTPACATGEEAYSIAMLLDEIAHELATPPDFQIFATDAAPELVAKASRGVFRSEALTGLSPTRQSRYLYQVDAFFRVKRFLREKLVFVPQDLLSDPPFAELDLVTCRNLFIYLERATVEEVLFRLHGALRTGGVLFLGRSEALPSNAQGFEAVSVQWNIYRKVGPMPGVRRDPVSTAPSSTARTAAALRVAHEQFDVPSALIDHRGDVLRTYGSTKGILTLPAGEPSLNLTDLVPREWVSQLQYGIRQVQESHDPLTLTNLTAALAKDTQLSMRLTPLQTLGGGAWDRILVSFIPEQDCSDALGAGDSNLLQDDLAVGASVNWKDEARTSREELEASREELQALNEELKASNEQLKQSNEDLNDVNRDLTRNIERLAMQSRVLLSGQVMALFLDLELRLQWFTPTMRDVFPLRQADTGRKIADLVPIFRDPHFYTDIQHVVRTGEAREAVTRDDKGRSFLRKTFPYLSETAAIAGVAITFADIGAHMGSEALDKRGA
ncbi:two-component system, chemotaxis family, CheB/CheR fusion protein [Ralstonia sp. 25mfcol4.1]|uniref:CheR family methyltransferase n=1 Tax=Ralstonia sp. 25mfcol4.1 TaxID=1761899 RepID=UPI0004241009|nr:CheR family methyltransferase [Ralstonia sp. 25mfcol4.1]SDP22732.1 two-component system, chemotaxis family, CheB/CheR fusion protein [Ralstonia sp. 25mfcol4.1]